MSMNDEGLLEQSEEFLTYRNDNDEARNLIERLITECESSVKNYDSEYKTNEILREQLERARELISSIEVALDYCKSAKQCIDAFNHECEKSMFER